MSRYHLQECRLWPLAATLLLLSVVVPLTVHANSDQATLETTESTLKEIVVTAQKKTERLQDVPIPVTVISADTLVQNNQLRLQDYWSQIPSLAYAGNGTDTSIIAIRGLATGAGLANPAVGIVVDDVPFGSSTGLGGAGAVYEFDPSEIQHIEVLRGPQGTLYGANSLGGLIKYVTVDPSTAGASGRVLLGTSSVHNGAELGYNASGSINVPLSDSAAVLGSAFTRQDPGYIDNPVLGIRGVNEARATGGRLSGLWKPSDAFSLKLGAMYQDLKSGPGHVDLAPGLGDLQQNDIRGSGKYERKSENYSAIITAKVGIADLTSVTGYNSDTQNFANDFDYGLGFLDGLTQRFLGIPNGTTKVLFPESRYNSKFSQEVRLSTPIGKSVEWLVGAFYTHERSPRLQTLLAADYATGATLGKWADFGWFVTYDEYAAFTDVTMHFTDRIDVQFGGRESHIKQSYAEVDTGPIIPLFDGGPSPFPIPEEVTKAKAFTYLVTPQFKVSPDLMVYARLASGYRPGGPNASASAFGLPIAYKPDETRNYELGVKGDTLEHTLSFEASLYYIIWKDIQITVTDPANGFGFTSNGSRAKSQGLELSAVSKPVSGLTIASWVAFSKAVLTEAFPSDSSTYGVAGDRLPFSSRFSGNVSLDQEFPLSHQVSGFVGGSISYVGARTGTFTTAPPAVRQDYPSYSKTDLRAGLKYASWMANCSVNNVADKRGLLFGNPGSPQFTYIQPRTIALSVSKTF